MRQRGWFLKETDKYDTGLRKKKHNLLDKLNKWQHFPFFIVYPIMLALLPLVLVFYLDFHLAAFYLTAFTVTLSGETVRVILDLKYRA